MRVGSTVLLNKQVSIQSYHWNTFRPLGRLQAVLDSLEEYHCDEVAIIRPVRDNDTLSDYEIDIAALRSIKSMTPISFGGGIRTSAHLDILKDLPIERLIFSSAFIEKDRDLIRLGTSLFGHQAIQCLLPLKFIDKELCVYSSCKSAYIPFSELDADFIEELANEIILVDTHNEGAANQFDWELVEATPFLNSKLIISGGIGKETIQIAKERNIASVLIDNKVLHQEYSIMSYKNAQ